MTYPLSAEVTAGQPTAAAQYNHLRSDALTLGNAAADSLDLAHFFNRHAEHMVLQYLANNRLRVPYSISKPPTLMINGYLLQATANVDLPANQFSGAAATWYVFAVRSPGSTTFTLAVNSSAAEATDQRIIGECVWNGSAVCSTLCYFTPTAALPTADYDSGWFAVATGQTYSKAHGLGQVPHIVNLLWCPNLDGSGSNYPVSVVYTNSPCNTSVSPLYYDGSLIGITCGSGTYGGSTIACSGNFATAGYYRILAWK
jgi:hypothetical protein